MTHIVTFADMFVNFGKCLQTFSNSGKIFSVESYKASQTHLASLWDEGVVTIQNFYDLSKEPNPQNVLIKCVLRGLYLCVVTVYLCVTLIPIISPHPLNHKVTI